MKSRVKLPAGQFGVGFPAKRDESVLNAGGIRAESALYDFTVDGGAIGTFSFGRKLPAGAIVLTVVSDELTNLTSGGSATLKLQAGSTDLIAATAIASFAGTQTIALASSATAIKLATDSELKLVVATAAITAGKVRFLVEYLLPTDGHH